MAWRLVKSVILTLTRVRFVLQVVASSCLLQEATNTSHCLPRSAINWLTCTKQRIESGVPVHTHDRIASVLGVIVVKLATLTWMLSRYMPFIKTSTAVESR